MDNIEKLREKLEKDPSSTLFVPLAEEYKKAGMLDEAIEVLKAGIEKKPAYMSARVALGKIYLEKGMKQDAAEEFKKVVSAIPDNFFAHKKLAEIYRDQNDIPRAREELKTLLTLNAKDEEVQAALKELEERAASAGKAQAAPAEEAPVKPAEEVKDLGIDLSPVQEEEPAPAEEVDSGDFVLSIADRDAIEEPGEDRAKPTEETGPRVRDYDDEPSIRQPLSGAEAESAAFWMPEDDGEDWKVGSAPPAETPVEEVSSEGLYMGGEPPPPEESVEEEMMEFPGLGEEAEEEIPEAEEAPLAVEETVPAIEETPLEVVEEATAETVEAFTAEVEEAKPEVEETPLDMEEIVPEVEGSLRESVEEAAPEEEETVLSVEEIVPEIEETFTAETAPEEEETPQAMEDIVAEVEKTVPEMAAEAVPDMETPLTAEDTFLEIEDSVEQAEGDLHRFDVPHNGGSDGLARADDFINSGEYGKAMEIYRKLLAENADDRAVLQKVEELKALLRLLGRGSDVVIAKFEAFLGAIKRRRDEFFKNP